MLSDLGLALTGDLQAFADGELAAIERGAMDAAYKMEIRGKGALRGDVNRAGLGPKVARTWRGAVFPRRALSMNPTVQLKTNAPLLINAFEEGAEIKSENGLYLSIPTDEFLTSISARARSQNRKNLVRLAEQKFGKLRFVAVRGKRIGLLVVDTAQRSRSARGGYRPASDSALRRGKAESIVLFVLVPRARLQKRLNVHAIETSLARDWPEYMARGIAQSLDEGRVETRT